MAYCSNCGEKLPDGAKFCSGCGDPIDNLSKNEIRKQVYDGVIHKCPNCGEILNSFDTNCPACNYELRDINAVSSVDTLYLKLNALNENSGGRKNRLVEKQKIELIENFPIPNSREDIFEFFTLASSQISAKIWEGTMRLQKRGL